VPSLLRFAPALAVSALLAVLALLLDSGARANASLVWLDVVGRVYFGLLVAAPLVLYPIAFFRGESLRWRVVLSLLPAALWWLTDVALRFHDHTLAEAIWLASSPVNGLHLNALALAMVVAEIACRTIAPRLGRVDQGHTRGTTLKIALVVLFFVTPVLPVLSISPFLEGYRALFQADLLPLPESRPGPALAVAPETIDPSAKRPNVIFILSDDHRHDVMGHAGHPFAETPALDRLAEEGVRFTRAYVTSSLCSPSRASFLTGTWPHRHGVWNNFTPWSNDNQTFLEHLGASGYDTAFIGKWHMPGGLPELRGVDHLVTFTAFGGQGVYRDCPLIVNGVEEPSRKSYIAEELTDRAIAWIERERDAPFALYLSHKNVHAPFAPDTPELGRHAEDDVARPEGTHPWVLVTNTQYVHLNHRSQANSVRSYVEAVESMDRQIARVLTLLDERGLTRDTLVIYASDNGQLWGEHGLMDKRWAYEESIRIPFLVRYPASGHVPGTKVDRLIQNIDLMPSLLDVAGLPTPDHVQGRSWLSLLTRPEAPWRDAIFYSYYFEPPYPAPTTRALRTETHKYIEYETRPPQLFDLEADPGEQTNLALDPQFDTLREVLAARLRVEENRAN
jgi:N-acetylglucosamine-6-sulfatase